MSLSLESLSQYTLAIFLCLSLNQPTQLLKTGVEMQGPFTVSGGPAEIALSH